MLPLPSLAKPKGSAFPGNAPKPAPSGVVRPRTCKKQSLLSEINLFIDMNCRFVKFRKEQGSTLIVTVVLGGILGMLMVSYLSMVNTQKFSVSRAQSWNKAIVVAEAGVEEALAHLNSRGVTTT